jgi:hypothetical protein
LKVKTLKILTLNLQKFSEGRKKYFGAIENFCRLKKIFWSYRKFLQVEKNILGLQKISAGRKKYFGATENFCRSKKIFWG